MAQFQLGDFLPRPLGSVNRRVGVQRSAFWPQQVREWRTRARRVQSTESCPSPVLLNRDRFASGWPSGNKSTCQVGPTESSDVRHRIQCEWGVVNHRWPGLSATLPKLGDGSAGALHPQRSGRVPAPRFRGQRIGPSIGWPPDATGPPAARLGARMSPLRCAECVPRQVTSTAVSQKVPSCVKPGNSSERWVAHEQEAQPAPRLALHGFLAAVVGTVDDAPSVRAGGQSASSMFDQGLHPLAQCRTGGGATSADVQH